MNCLLSPRYQCGAELVSRNASLVLWCSYGSVKYSGLHSQLMQFMKTVVSSFQTQSVTSVAFFGQTKWRVNLDDPPEEPVQIQSL